MPVPIAKKVLALGATLQVATKTLLHLACVKLYISQMPRSDSSLDSSSDFSDDDADEDYRLAQKEWNESIEELQQLALVLLLPWAGKYLGRRCSYWRM